MNAMTPDTELGRLFAQVFPSIPKPDGLGTCELDAPWNEAKNRMIRQTLAALAPTDPVDADEAVNGVCAQGEDE